MFTLTQDHSKILLVDDGVREPEVEGAGLGLFFDPEAVDEPLEFIGNHLF